MIRKTYAVINGDILENNIKEIKNTYKDYEYYIGVVKNNAYHHGIECINSLIKGGVNYLAVSSLEEARNARHYDTLIPILCLEPIDLEYIYDAMNDNVTITIENLDYLKKLLKMDLSYDLKIHLAVDSGMHRLGFTKKKDITEAVSLIKKSKHLILEGIYSHFATSGIMDPYYDRQVETFLSLTSDIDLKEIPIVHLGRSETLVYHEKLSFCNGIRLGIVMYGFNGSRRKNTSLRGRISLLKRKYYQKKFNCSKTTLENNLAVLPAFSLYTTILSVRKVKSLDVVGYGARKIEEDGYILTLPIGYADGVTKEFRSVIIDKERCPILSDCMDMLMVFSKKKREIGELVEIFGKEKPIKEVTASLNVNAYHLFNMISNRVPRIHVYNNEEKEITY